MTIAKKSLEEVCEMLATQQDEYYARGGNQFEYDECTLEFIYGVNYKKISEMVHSNYKKIIEERMSKRG